MKPLKIARISLIEREEFPTFEIAGLSIFCSNGYEASPLQDPRIVFLKNLVESNNLSCLIGLATLKDLGDSIEDLFGLEIGPVAYEVRTGILEGCFYDVDDGEVGGVFLPEARLLFNLQSKTNIEHLLYLIRCGAIAVYKQEKMNQISTGSLIKYHHHLVIYSGHDGITLEGPQIGFNEQVISALLKTIDELRSNEWFRANEASWKWDELEQCLVIK